MSPSFQIGKLLVAGGIALIAVGLLFIAGSKLSLFGLGRLPGDIVHKGKNTTFYFPIVSCLIVSVVLTTIFWLISFFSRK